MSNPELEEIIRDILLNNAEDADLYKKMQHALMRPIVGKVLRATKGQCNPREVELLSIKILNEHPY